MIFFTKNLNLKKNILCVWGGGDWGGGGGSDFFIQRN